MFSLNRLKTQLKKVEDEDWAAGKGRIPSLGYIGKEITHFVH